MPLSGSFTYLYLQWISKGTIAGQGSAAETRHSSIDLACLPRVSPQDTWPPSPVSTFQVGGATAAGMKILDLTVHPTAYEYCTRTYRATSSNSHLRPPGVKSTAQLIIWIDAKSDGSFGAIPITLVRRSIDLGACTETCTLSCYCTRYLACASRDAFNSSDGSNSIIARC